MDANHRREGAPGRGRIGACLMIALLAGSALPLLAPVAQAETSALMAFQLPGPRASGGAVYDGKDVYVFGGVDGSGTYLGTLLKVNPVTGTASTPFGVCCTGNYGSGAFWDGTSAYFTGGTGSCIGTFCRTVLRLNPAANSFGFLAGGSDVLPTPRWLHAAIHDGQNGYLFGGRSGGGVADLTSIAKFNTTTLSVTTVANLPYAMEQAGAVWTGQHAYIIGGYSSAKGYGSDIIRFTPSTNAVAVVAQLPTGVVAPGVAWDGLHVYVFGGTNQTRGVIDDIQRFTPSTNEVSMVARLPKPNVGSHAAWIGQDAYILGGYSPPAYSRDVVKFSWTAPSAPRNPGATGVLATGAVNLAWQAPALDGGRPVSGYSVQRGPTSGSETHLTTVGNVLTYTDNTCPARQACYYTLSAVNSVGEGPVSTEVAVVPPSAPQDLAAAWDLLPPGGAITLSWSAPADPGSSALAGYAIYRGAHGGDLSLLTTVGGGATSFVDETCPDLQVCYYEVAAFNSQREGPLSDEVYANGIVCAAYDDGALLNACAGVLQGANPTAVPGAGLCVFGPACVPDPGPLPVPTAAPQGFLELTGLCGTTPECRVDLAA